MKRIVRIKTYEMEYGPHFNAEHAKKAVSKMINEDGTKGPHWSIEETTNLAKQHNVHIGDYINKYDWYVALNMIYSDFYKFIVSTTGTNNSKHFVEMAKAWINDKDIDEGKMWYYYIYVMCDKIREAEEEYSEKYIQKHRDEDDDDEEEYHGNYRRMGRMSMYGKYKSHDRDYDKDYDEYDTKDEDDYHMEETPRRYHSIRYVRY